jgi:predicted nucleic acid-binding protein
VDASELLRGEEPCVADTSAWWRAADLPHELGSLLEQAIVDDRLWLTPIVRMEILYSARTSSEYVALAAELDALRIPAKRPRGRPRGDKRARRAGRARRRLSPGAPD